MIILTIYISSARGIAIFVRYGSWMNEVDSLVEGFLTCDPQYHSTTRYNRWLPSITQPQKLHATTGTSPREKSAGKAFEAELLVTNGHLRNLNPITRGCSAVESGGDVLCPIPHIDNLGGIICKTEDEESQPVEQKRKR